MGKVLEGGKNMEKSMEEEEESVDVAGCVQVYLEEGRDAATDRKNETGRWA